MEPTKEAKILFESLQNTMFQLIEIDPANGWHWIFEAQRRTFEAQTEMFLKRSA